MMHEQTPPPARELKSSTFSVRAIPIRAITRVTGASKTTVMKLVVDAGCAAAWYQDRAFSEPDVQSRAG